MRYGLEHTAWARVIACIIPANIASRRVLERLGFSYERDVNYIEFTGNTDYDMDDPIVPLFALARERFAPGDAFYRVRESLGEERTMTSQTSRRPVAADDLAAIEQAAMDYELGWYEGDAARIGRALSPDLVKRAFLRDRQTGEERLYELSRAQMVEKTQQGGGTATPLAQRYYDIAVLDVYGDIACARAESAKYVDYLQLACRDGQWVIVNVLWAYNGDSARK